QLLAFPADLALNSLNLPAESRNWATRGILCETGKAQRGRVDSGRKKREGGPLVCGERVVELSGDGGREPLQLFGLDNNGCGSSVVTFHQQQRWMAAIVGCKERNELPRISRADRVQVLSAESCNV
ncbi:hypothetical protein KUCAC02_024441, partial [Chaenocephalus aceratus]